MKVFFLKEAQKAGFEVLGIEPNIYAANYAKERGLPSFIGSFEETFDKVKDKNLTLWRFFILLNTCRITWEI